MSRVLFAIFYAAACCGLTAGWTSRNGNDVSWKDDIIEPGWEMATAMWKKWQTESKRGQG